ncbi:MAG: hypothetical protein KJ000_36380 [Pirellulaceae bacterium]|nr:hypothetical protein [Pirellulaceae bacterium]
MNEESATPWHGDWRRRLQAKIDVLGFSDLEQYLAANPGLGYVQLAETLGEANISAAQIYGEQIQRAAKRGETRLAAKDCLARLLNEYLRRGWGVGRHFSRRLASVYAAWATTIKANAKDDLETATRLNAVFDQLEVACPPTGWLPRDANDEILCRVFEKGWPIDQDDREESMRFCW